MISCHFPGRLFPLQPSMLWMSIANKHNYLIRGTTIKRSHMWKTPHEIVPASSVRWRPRCMHLMSPIHRITSWSSFNWQIWESTANKRTLQFSFDNPAFSSWQRLHKAPAPIWSASSPTVRILDHLVLQAQYQCGGYLWSSETWRKRWHGENSFTVENTGINWMQERASLLDMQLVSSQAPASPQQMDRPHHFYDETSTISQ